MQQVAFVRFNNTKIYTKYRTNDSNTNRKSQN